MTTTPTAIMFDSAAPHLIPDGFAGAAVCAAVYINGRYAWPQSQVARFERVIRISVMPEAGFAAHARVIDVERFDATPANARGFIKERIRLGHHDATVYCSKAAVASVQKACSGLEYRLWVADWTGVPHEDPDAWAVQYKTGPNEYDVTEVYGRLDFSRP